MTFHRRVLPSYFIAGGNPLLSGYDMINDPTHPSVGGSGVAVSADGKKSGGPNDGTYFVAFGEDGTSSFTNRPASALAENTDAIDDILRTSIPVITFVDATASGATSTHALTGQIYVGKTGSANNQAQRDKIVRVTDQNNNDLEVSGTKVVASLIHDGSAVNVVGTQASGFRTNASVNFNVPIPDTTTYRVWHGIRDNYGNISLVNKGGLFEESLRTVNNIPGEVRSLLRQIHSEVAVNQAFDAAFDSTIRSLASAGLNERYRRATTQPAGFITADYNVAGGGRVILRDGGAVEIATADVNLASASFPDVALAALRIRPALVRSIGNPSFSTGKGGDIGLMFESEWQASGDFGNEVVRAGIQGPALMDVIPRDIRDETLDSGTALTFINAEANATTNPDSGAGVDDQRTIQCAAGQYFLLDATPDKTAIRLGVDLIEVTFQSGGTPPETYVIDSIISATRIRVRHLNGEAASGSFFGATAITDVRIRWLQVSVRIGGSMNRSKSGSFGNHGFPLLVIPPAPSSDDPANVPEAPFFGSQVRDPGTSFLDSGSLASKTSFSWGSANDATGALTVFGRLLGDGSAIFLGGRQRFNKINIPANLAAVSGAGTTPLNYIAFSVAHVRIAALANGQTRRFNITLPTGDDVVEGDLLYFRLDCLVAVTGAITEVALLDVFTDANLRLVTDPDPGGPGSQYGAVGDDAVWTMRGGTGQSQDGDGLTLEMVAFNAGGTLSWFVKSYRHHLQHL